jgi:Holliday junction resolvase RusA-like endonuclease
MLVDSNTLIRATIERLSNAKLLCQYVLMYPPSTNNLYERKRSRTTGRYNLKQSVKLFRDDSMSRIWKPGIPNTITVNVRVELLLSPPDNRERDSDNPVKSVFDVLELTRVLKRDKQIRKHSVEFLPASPGGFCVVRVFPLDVPNG